MNALDDPFLAPECFPYEEANRSCYLFLESPASGGHLGFIDLVHGFQPWYQGRVIEFFSGLALEV
jgi:predicted alpha/beta-fold hydrolase